MSLRTRCFACVPVAALSLVARVASLAFGAFGAIGALGASVALGASGCGAGKDMDVVIVPSQASNEWPAPAIAPPDASTVRNAVASADGAQVRVRAYLVAVNLPCPACNNGLGARKTAPPREENIGRARPREATVGPGCSQCPAQAATFSDEGPKAAASGDAPTLRAVGVAEGLQPRHVGHAFLLTGTFHAKGENGPELDVTDVRALEK